MLHERKNKLYRWEVALLFGVAIALLTGTRLSGQQAALSGQLVRLHVIGASDSEPDQAAKLLARDAVLSVTSSLLEGVETREEAMAVLGEHLEELARAGAEAAGVPASVSLERDAWFPTREYTDFALPAGRYPALRVALGAGEGRNWWCVVFPPLCTESVVEVAAGGIGDLTEDQIRLITGESGGYAIRFRALELWSEWVERFDCKS